MKKNVRDIYLEKFDINIDELPEYVRNGLEDVENNHDRSWTLDVYLKNKDNLDKRAGFYRGTKITYRELFKKVEEYAIRFKKLGINENSEVPICMANCPEFLYSIMALNLLGSRVNVFGEFDSDYITEIINGCNSSFLICTDDKFEKIRGSIVNSKISDVIMFSLTDSLKDGIDPYYELDKEFYDFKNRVPEYKNDKELNIYSKSDFKAFYKSSSNKKYKVGNLIKKYSVTGIDSEFLVTYSSGSTNRPKAIKHNNRSLLTMGRFQDPDLSGLPEMHDLVGEALIPPHSNTDIITSISDVLYKGCTVAFEPIYNPKAFLNSLIINKTNYVSAPRNMILLAAKQIYADERYKGIKLPQLMILTSVGEPTSAGEEKFINKMLRKVKAGSAKFPFPAVVSLGGGDCERGGMFFKMLSVYQNLNPKFSLTGKKCYLKPYAMVIPAVLGENGEILDRGKVGRLVVKTPTVMTGYKNNPEATRLSFIRDKNGNKWCNCNVYAKVDKFGTVDILDRYGKDLILDSGERVPLYRVGKEIEKNTKNILSYEVVDIDGILVIHLEFQPGVKNNISKILSGIESMVEKACGPEVVKKMVYRIRSFDEHFSGTKCEKRDYNALVAEGISEKCIKQVYNGNEYEIISADEYLSSLTNNKVLRKVNIKK